MCACAGSAGRGAVSEDRLHVAGRHHVGRVLHVHAAGVRRAQRLVRARAAGGLPAAGQDLRDAAPRPAAARPRHSAGRRVRLLQSGRTHHVLVARLAATPLQVNRGQSAVATMFAFLSRCCFYRR